ncbi:hypothetical protein N7452_010422 [Penicillium brevicompactum]|uniref:Uncharacterized protein n=1 Tax=Penicillium brevicompactum TaxID=5074 RepID=A0A9W9UB16_PENBR|nr:hypothetical protein N7452_010422 [Penicillium brevicompactum]
MSSNSPPGVWDFGVRPQFVWCLSCLNMQMMIWASGNHLEYPSSIQCQFKGTGTSKCRNCMEIASECILTPGLMIGDAYDLQMIFNWASSFWNHDLQGFTWNSGFRGGVARALHELAEAFADIVRAHQEEPCTTVSGDIGPIAYKTLMAQRQQVILNGCTTYANYDGQPLLRLIPGDAGYPKWGDAKDNFLRQVLMATEAHFAFLHTNGHEAPTSATANIPPYPGNQQDETTGPRMWAIRSTFPLPS